MKTITVPGGTGRIVQWTDKKTGKVVATSRPTTSPLQATPYEPSADELFDGAAALAAEAFETDDLARRDRFIAEAGRMNIRAADAREREIAQHLRRPVDKVQIDRWVARAIETLR